MRYRTALESDVEQIALLHAESWRRTYRGMLRDEFLDGDVVTNRREAWRDRLRRPRADQFVCVADDQGQLLGFVCAYGNEDPTWGSLVDNLHVAHEHRGGGVGTRLMGHARVWLLTNYPRCGVYLWVMEANRSARRFYEKLEATNEGIVEKENPGGGSARNCRYAWSSPRALGSPVRKDGRWSNADEDRIEVVEYDPRWLSSFEQEAASIRSAGSDRVRGLLPCAGR